MFKNYQELIVKYAEFYKERIFSDQSQFKLNPIDSPVIGSKTIDEYGNTVVIGSFNSLSVVDFLHISTLFIGFIIVKRYHTHFIKTSVSTSQQFPFNYQDLSLISLTCTKISQDIRGWTRTKNKG